MKVTESGFENRQLHIEDYLQMATAEQEEYAGVFDYARITEKSGVITDFWTDNLLDLILRKDNMNKAYKKVKSNGGAGGIDGMQVDEGSSTVSHVEREADALREHFVHTLHHILGGARLVAGAPLVEPAAPEL